MNPTELGESTVLKNHSELTPLPLEMKTFFSEKMLLIELEIDRYFNNLSKADLTVIYSVIARNGTFRVLDQDIDGNFQLRTVKPVDSDNVRPKYIVNTQISTIIPPRQTRYETALEIPSLRVIGMKFIPDDPEFPDVALREARAQGNAETAGIVPIFNAFKYELGTIVVMSHKNKGQFNTLYEVISDKNTTVTTERLNDRPVFSPQRIKTFARNMLKALTVMEKKKIFNFDLKPDNIYVSNDTMREADQISDFGLSPSVRDPQNVYGTPGYISPEMATGDVTTDTASISTDLFSLSTVLYEMMTGRHLIVDPSGENDPLNFIIDSVNLSKDNSKIATDPALKAYAQQYGLDFNALVAFFKKNITLIEYRSKTIKEYMDLLLTALEVVNEPVLASYDEAQALANSKGEYNFGSPGSVGRVTQEIKEVADEIEKTFENVSQKFLRLMRNVRHFFIRGEK